MYICVYIYIYIHTIMYTCIHIDVSTYLDVSLSYTCTNYLEHSMPLLLKGCSHVSVDMYNVKVS